jgi:hypothetical protein
VEGVKQEHPTLDVSLLYRCMLVGMDDVTFNACKVSVSPLEAIRVNTARDACTRMSEVLPLVVVITEAAAPAEVAELTELAKACGAEVIEVAQPVDRSTFGRQVLDALQKGEARRIPR